MLIIYTLALLTITPQIQNAIPLAITIGSFDLYLFDILTAGVFFFWIIQFLYKKQKTSMELTKINKLFLALLIIGLLPVLTGINTSFRQRNQGLNGGSYRAKIGSPTI